MSDKVFFGAASANSNWPSASKSMIEKGQDPKELMIEVCKPQCKFYEDKLRRCEHALQTLTSLDPEKNCMYPMRDWVTCVDGCVQPKIINLLRGHEKGLFS